MCQRDTFRFRRDENVRVFGGNQRREFAAGGFYKFGIAQNIEDGDLDTGLNLKLSQFALYACHFNRERFMATTYGYSTSEWEATRAWIARRLRRVAADQATITYSDLCTEMGRAGVLALDPHGSALAGILGQVNVLEHEADAPLISALVVHKAGDWQPGVGFWSFAREIGVDPGPSQSARSSSGGSVTRR